MVIQNQHPIDPPIIGLYELFHRVNDDIFFVNSPCVFTENKLLKIKEVYEIHNLPDEGVNLKYIKLLWVYFKGFDFYIIGIDIQNGELLRRKQRLNADELPCSFLIAELFYFMEGIEDKVIDSYRNGNGIT